MNEYVRLHVEEALKEASEKAKIRSVWETIGGLNKYLGSYSKIFKGYEVIKESILNSYDLSKIK